MGRSWELAQELKNEDLIAQRRARLEEFEDRICTSAAQIIEAQLSFSEVTPGQEAPPPAWVEEFGEEGAKQRLAVAKTGWLPKSLAPTAVDLAARVTIGIARARRNKLDGAPPQINVTMTLPQPTSTDTPAPVAYPRKRLE